MQLVIDGKIIDTPIKTILETLRRESGRPFFKEIRDKRDNIVTNCPSHKDGQENHPSCQVYQCEDNPDVEYGFTHCFSCGYKAPLYQVVADVLNTTSEVGKEWLTERFGNILLQKTKYLPELIINPKHQTFLDESILTQYNYYHPYMEQRGLTRDVIIKYRIGFNKNRQTITFPVWDDKGHLVMITERSVHDKTFYIEEEVDKPIYLLNFRKQEGCDTVYVMESQINALVACGWGYPSVALFGTGSAYQYKILKQSGIRRFILCFDGDDAGKLGVERFKANMPDYILIDDVPMYPGKDIADLDKQTFEKLLETIN